MNDEEFHRAMCAVPQAELAARQLAQTELMRGMSNTELAHRYGAGLLNQDRYRTPREDSDGAAG